MPIVTLWRRRNEVGACISYRFRPKQNYCVFLRIADRRNAQNPTFAQAEPTAERPFPTLGIGSRQYDRLWLTKLPECQRLITRIPCLHYMGTGTAVQSLPRPWCWCFTIDPRACSNNNEINCFSLHSCRSCAGFEALPLSVWRKLKGDQWRLWKTSR